MNLKPSEYQLIPLLKLINNKLNAILITDGVGVGKTISSIYIAIHCYYLYKQPVIIYCPAALVSKWKFELLHKFNINATSVNDYTSFKSAHKHLSKFTFNDKQPYVVIFSNSFLHKKIPDFDGSCIIFDEIHNYRNSETQSYQTARNVALNGKFRIGLSATPINNQYEDLVSELSILCPEYQYDTLDSIISSNWEDLSKTLLSFTTNYRKDKLKIHFTKRKIKWINVNYDSEYISHAKQLIYDNKPDEAQSFFSVVTYYRLAASNKTAFYKSLHHPLPDNLKDQKIDALNSLLDKKSINKAIIFCAFKETVNDLSKKIKHKNIISFTGDTPENLRDKILQKFQNSDNILLIMTEVGSEGLDLQSCNVVINYDLHWNPMRLEQRIGRIDRIGQNKKSIFIYNFLVAGSIDERIINTMQSKLSLIENSIFKADDIIEESNIKKSNLLYDPSIFTEEQVEVETFVDTLKTLKVINSSDYSILSNIKTEYCTPNNLIKLTTQNNLDNIWKNKSKGDKWIDTISSSSQSFIDLLNYFES